VNAPARARRRRGQAPGGGVWLSSAFKRVDLYPDRIDARQATVRMLAATVRDLAARGVRTIVLIAPIHLQALQMTTAYERRDIAGALAIIREAVTANGGAVVDLAAALPRETSFTDAYTHFTPEGNRIVASGLFAELHRLVQD
jgi:hypothetical protein